MVFGGQEICGTVSELRDGVDHKFSDLPRDEERLVLGSYFLHFLVCWQRAGWWKTTLTSVLFTGPRPSVLNRAGLMSVAATERVCWARSRWVRVVYQPRLNRAGLHLREVMCCYRVGNAGTLLS